MSTEKVTVNIASMFEVFEDRENTKALIGAGYGKTESGKLPEKLRATAIPVASFFCGRGRFVSSNCEPFREFVLADERPATSSNRADSCGGDSGAPIFWKPPPEWFGEEESSGRKDIMLVGITSRAVIGVRHNENLLCGGGGIYTAVGHPDVIQWLESHGISAWSAFAYRFAESRSGQ